MLPSYQDIIKDTSAEIAKLRAEIPDTLRGFSAMAQGASKPGALDAKTKELVAYAGLNFDLLDGRFRNRIGYAQTDSLSQAFAAYLQGLGTAISSFR